MKDTQLLKMLGEIDNKFLDEALGGDSEKPIKIDTSRAPIKWYRIAAPIAACLVLGAGILTMSRFINRSGPVNPPVTSDTSDSKNPPITSDTEKNDFVSATEADLETCKQLLLEKYPNIESFSTRIMDINFDGADEAVVRPYGGDSIVHIFSKYNGEMTETGYIDTEPYEYCIGDLSELKEYDPSIHLEAGNHYWYFHFKTENKDAKMFAEAVARINYIGGPSYIIDFPVAAYTTDYTGSDIDNLTLKKDWWYSYNFKGSGIDSGTEISRNLFASLWDKHIPYEELNAAFVEYLKNNEPLQSSMKEAYPDLSKRDVPVSDSPYLDPEEPSEIERAKITNVRLEGTDCFVSLVGENIFSLVEDNGRYIRMDKMSVILFKRDFETFTEDDKLLAIVDIDPIDASSTNSRHGNIIIRPYNHAFELYHLNDIDIIAIGDGDYIRSDGANCNFVALTKEGKLLLLKGTDLNGDTVSPCVSTSGRLAVSGNSLLDPENGVEFRFFPEMFKYADPDADHAHFKCGEYNALSEIKGGYVYNIFDDSMPSKECNDYSDGTQEDLNRWNSFISSAVPAVIHVSEEGGGKTPLSDINANALFTIIKTAKLTVVTELTDPPASGFGNGIVGCDSDGNVLFEVYYNRTVVSVAFDDSGKFYEFDSTNSGLESILNFLGR